MPFVLQESTAVIARNVSEHCMAFHAFLISSLFCSFPYSVDVHVLYSLMSRFLSFFQGCLLTGCFNGETCLFDNRNETFSCFKLPIQTGHNSQVETG